MITSLEIKDKTFSMKFRGYDAEEVDEFLDIVVRDFEDLVCINHDKDVKIKALEERLAYFDEMKESLSQSVLIAQDAADKVKQAASTESRNIVHQAEQNSQHLLEDAKYKANEILRQAADSAMKVAIETEKLKNKTRVFHQHLKSTIESQLSLVNSSDWAEILRPTTTYLQASNEPFKKVVEEALGQVDTKQDRGQKPIDIHDVAVTFSSEIAGQTLVSGAIQEQPEGVPEGSVPNFAFPEVSMPTRETMIKEELRESGSESIPLL